MSIFIKIDEKILLMTKGADTMMIPILNKAEISSLKESIGYITEYSKIGLRTLCLAQKELTVEE
jgi:magnesium-transporting ATPase (P-type)